MANIKEQQVTCPYCKRNFELTKAISNQIEDLLKGEHNQEIIQLKKKQEEDIVKIQKDIEKKITERLAKEREEELKKIKVEALKTAKKEISESLTEKEDELEEANKKILKYRQNEKLVLRKERELEESKHTMTKDFTEKLNKEVKKAYADAQVKIEDTYKLKLLEKEKTINDLNKKMKEGQKKAEQGSMQLQGEVQEIELENILSHCFIYDEIRPVETGKRGGDIIQGVKSDNGKLSGTILWESKRTKNWSDAWIDKLKNDMRQSKADVAVIVTEVLPSDIQNFNFRDGIWITDIKYALGLATALRLNLIQVYQARAAMSGMSEKKDLVYNYLTGNEFRQRVEAIVEAFKSMQDDLNNERVAMEKSWAKRDKQIKSAFQNVAGIFGDFHGLGANLLPVKNLELMDNSDIGN